jgi:hypothetical protein
MEFAPWGGRPVSCVSDNQCVAEGGGGDAPLSAMMVKCTLLTGLPDGAKDGRYCACYPFSRGLTCQEATPVLQLQGFLMVPCALLAMLALWRALRDLRECPRKKRASPGAVCLMLATCAASSFALCVSCLCVVRWTGGNAALSAIYPAARMSSAVMSFTTALYCSLVFECISASAEQRTVHQKRWYTFFALFVAAFFASYSKVPFSWQRSVVLAVGILVVVLLWIRAAWRLTNTLADNSAGSTPLAEKARVTREFIHFFYRFLALELGCLSALALLDNLSPLPVIVSSSLLDAVNNTAVAALLLRFQVYLGTPLRRAGACSFRRPRVRPFKDRHPQKPSMLMSDARVHDVRVSGAQRSSGDTLPLSLYASASAATAAAAAASAAATAAAPATPAQTQAEAAAAAMEPAAMATAAAAAAPRALRAVRSAAEEAEDH